MYSVALEGPSISRGDKASMAFLVKAKRFSFMAHFFVCSIGYSAAEHDSCSKGMALRELLQGFRSRSGPEQVFRGSAGGSMVAVLQRERPGRDPRPFMLQYVTLLTSSWQLSP